MIETPYCRYERPGDRPKRVALRLVKMGGVHAQVVDPPKIDICCEDFGWAETKEMIVATDKGWAALGENDTVAFDVRFCPFCGHKLPEIK